MLTNDLALDPPTFEGAQGRSSHIHASRLLHGVADRGAGCLLRTQSYFLTTVSLQSA